MEIDIIFDTVCPWCFIGKKRLENALASRPNISVKPNWKPFLLNPEMPPQGIDRTAYLIKKFGSEARINHIYGAIGEAGQSVEIDFAFERINRTPNSVNSHRLVRFAEQREKSGDVVEALFVEFFINGRDIGGIDVLVDIGEAQGLNADDLRGYLESGDDEQRVYDENIQAHRLGINGVPSYVFNEKFLISGAQDPMVLSRMLDVAAATTKMT
ncbi:MAG: DsbA family oxidoreductase [Alphaproteobacteria bacterium]|jgi:predicted DsbA family dithiol-disulfide isomerase|nr:DsbA family oxidoreductase [Alphaproteobacteria bacterium]MBT7706768.1 DsbA family oxidoreductase [archaeon]